MIALDPDAVFRFGEMPPGDDGKVPDGCQIVITCRYLTAREYAAMIELQEQAQADEVQPLESSRMVLRAALTKATDAQVLKYRASNNGGLLDEEQISAVIEELLDVIAAGEAWALLNNRMRSERMTYDDRKKSGRPSAGDGD